jgi:hypothetical protein
MLGVISAILLIVIYRQEVMNDRLNEFNEKIDNITVMSQDGIKTAKIIMPELQESFLQIYMLNDKMVSKNDLMKYKYQTEEKFKFINEQINALEENSKPMRKQDTISVAKRNLKIKVKRLEQ